MVIDKTISFIGTGKMAEALIKGLLYSKLISSEKIIASDPEPQRLRYIVDHYKIKATGSNLDALKFGEIIILAVKPQKMKEVLSQIKSGVKDKLIISIAAGIKLETLEKSVAETRVIRVMPNNPCFVGEGISAICQGSRASRDDLEIAETIFESVGKVINVEEKLMDAVTALTGSGPGFVYYFLEAFIEAGKKLGFSEEKARELALGTFSGSVKTALETKKSPDVLREMVTSPGGTTLEGMKVLEKGKFKEILIKAIAAARRRAEELSKEYK